MTKIKLRTAGIDVGERTSARTMDLDHAQTIIEYCGRGYTVSASSNESPMWTMAFHEFSEGKIFVNMPETTKHDDRNIMYRPHYGTEDGRLHDNQPKWQHKLIDLCRLAGGDNIHWH